MTIDDTETQSEETSGDDACSADSDFDSGSDFESDFDSGDEGF